MGKSLFRKFGEGLGITALGGIGELKGMEPLGKITRPIRKEAEGKIPSLVAASTLATTGNPGAAFAAAAAAKKAIDAKESYLQSRQQFRTGGTVKGPKNKHVVAILHSGEFVLPTSIKPTKAQKSAVSKLKAKK
jgi:hypothetical protein